VPSWCGPKKITLGLTDGFGGNSWRLVTTASAKDEISKCPSVTGFTYADGQGNTQKAISDIQGLVAKGVNAIVVFPDAGNAILPALQSAHSAGVTTVPYRVFPGGTDGKDYDVWVGADFTTDGKNWGNWILKNLPNGGNVLFLSGPKGNSQGITEGKALHAVLDPTGKYKFIGEQPFEPTNWDPAVTQQVLTAAIAKYPKIDVIVSDFGPSLVGALPAFTKSNRSIPALVTSDGNVLSCFYEDNKAKNPDFKMFTVATGNDNARLAVDWAVALASGGTKPTSKQFEAPAFEDSVSSVPNPVTCKKNLPGDIYLSAQMPGAAQAKLLK
jgi:ribose transport system substrate-binding protein